MNILESRIALACAILIAPLVLGSSTQAQSPTGVNGSYHPTPSWNQTFQGSARFVLLASFNNEAVLDLETGLVWERSPGPKHYQWTRGLLRSRTGEFVLNNQEAPYACADKFIGDRKGWRLPSVHELTSLVDRYGDLSSPFITLPLPAGHPFIGVQFETYWTATTDSISTDKWVVSFRTGRPGIAATTQTNGTPIFLPVWCVRGGGPVTQY